jgi:hypothetical protein
MGLSQHLDKCPRFSNLHRSRHITSHDILAIFKDQDVMGLEAGELSVTDAAKRAPRTKNAPNQV